MFDRIKVGLLETINPVNRTLYNRLQEVGNVRPIGPKDYLTAMEILVIPPNVGMNPSAACFENGNYNVIPPYPVDPFVMYFVQHHLDYIIKKGIPIIGIGDGCAIIWNKVGGKCVLADQGIQCLVNPKPSNLLKLGLDNDIFIRDGFSIKDKLFGFPLMNEWLTQILQELQDEILEDLAIIKSTPLDSGEEPTSTFVDA